MMGSSIPFTTLGFLMSFTVLSFTKTSTAQAPNYFGDDCHNSTPQALSASYRTNLEKVLSWLSSDAATSKGYNHTAIGNRNDTVYGLYDCRGDDAGYVCQFCVSTATREVLQRCPDRPSAIVWYDFCALRYSNKNFIGNLTTSPLWYVGSAKKVSDLMEPGTAENHIRSLIERATNETKQLYAMGGFDLGGGRRRYGMVQCSRDLSDKSCRQCLKAMVDKIPQCCEQKQVWAVGCPSCVVIYNDHMFYQLGNQTSSSSPNPTTNSKNGVSKSKALIISISLSMVGALLSCFVYFWRRKIGSRKDSKSGVSKSKALIISISISMALVILSCSIYFWRRKIRSRKDEWLSQTSPIFYDLSQTESSLNTDLPTIPLIVIQQSTNHFSAASKLGQGGFGPVYKGTLTDGREIAVKRLSKTSGQGLEEFKNEVIFIAKLQHRNLVRLLGCCIEKNEKLLVYEYLPNSSLDFHLFNKANTKKLDWKQRLSIINGIARGILYLHEDSRLRVIHRDLKASNVLLDSEMNPKISDFGLAKTFEGAQNQGNTKRVMGTYGYMAPEYAMEGLFSIKSDVFSFGILLLEIMCGKKNSGFYLSEHGQSLLIYTWRLWCEGKCLELMDPILEESYTESEVLKCIHIGLLCVQEDAVDRPTMSIVVVMLASDTMTLPKPKHPAFSVGRMAMEESSSSKNSKDPSINDITVSHIAPR